MRIKSAINYQKNTISLIIHKQICNIEKGDIMNKSKVIVLRGKGNRGRIKQERCAQAAPFG